LSGGGRRAICLSNWLQLRQHNTIGHVQCGRSHILYFAAAVLLASQPGTQEANVNPLTSTAEKFFEACETGKGWEVCKAYCSPNATFAAQAEPLANVNTVAQYCDWMKGLFKFIPDGRYELVSFATDDKRKNVCAYAVFHGTHSGPGGPMPPTGKKTATDYVYVMQFDGDKISHMQKIWNAGLAMKELGWA